MIYLIFYTWNVTVCQSRVEKFADIAQGLRRIGFGVAINLHRGQINGNVGEGSELTGLEAEGVAKPGVPSAADSRRFVDVAVWDEDQDAAASNLIKL